VAISGHQDKGWQVKLKEVAAQLGLKKGAELLELEWESSQNSMPPEGPPFLAPEFVTDACRALYLPQEVTQKALAASRRIAAHPALRALVWHCHYCLLRCPNYLLRKVRDWPSLEVMLQDDAGMFYFLVLLSAVPQMQAIHRAHAVPPDIVRDTLLSLKSAMGGYRKEHGTWGVTGHNVGWLSNHLRGILYRLGRLHFQFGSFHYKLRAFRHSTLGAVVALSEEGVRYRSDGQICRADDDTSEAWSSELITTDDEITGNPILPTGAAVQKKVTLAAAQWRQVLAPGDPVLNIHIPGGGPMDHDLCGQSFRTALDFFPRHFPERPFVAFCCSSWILNTCLEELLPPTSNLVRFQQEVYIFPTQLDEQGILKVALGGVPEDLSKAPRDTTLQRAVLDTMASDSSSALYPSS